MHNNCINSFVSTFSPELDLEEHPDRQSGSPKPSRKALNSDSGTGPAFALHNEKGLSSMVTDARKNPNLAWLPD